MKRQGPTGRTLRRELGRCSGKPRSTRPDGPPEAAMKEGRVCPESWREHSPADTLILDFYPSGLSEISFNHLICADLLSTSRKLIQAGILIQDHELCQILVLFNISLCNVFKPQLSSLKKSMISKPDKDRKGK